MAKFPSVYETQFKPSPGMHGEEFSVNMPGYRDGETRINRTNNHMNIGPHEALNQKYMMDRRLKVLFTYGFAVGYNKMFFPKGRIVAADPYMQEADWQTDKFHSVLTLANGGAPVKLRDDSDVYPTAAAAPDAVSAVSSEGSGIKTYAQGREWAPIIGIDEAYKDGYYNALADAPKTQMEAAGLTVDARTGKLMKDNEVTDLYRPANKPLGMIERNEYSRFNDDSLDGMIPGPVITDAVVEMPLFAFKDEAESNPWGSIYGNVNAGDLVKSDENGRLTVSPLSIDTLLENMTPAQVERERQQVIGQVISVSFEMVPEGGYKWATWALEDRLRYEGFAPDLYTQNNRPGEDIISASVYRSTGRYPGYPYDVAYTQHDLHMLESTGRQDHYDKFMNQQYLYDNLGIPGLTDGYNVAVNNMENNNAAVIRARLTPTDRYLQQLIRINPNGNVEKDSVYVKLTKVEVAPDGTITETALTPARTGDVHPEDGNFVLVPETVNQPVSLDDGDGAFAVTFFNAIQGMMRINVVNPEAADAILANGATVRVDVKYKKRGMAGVPTWMDWKGCKGSAKILMQR